jgi:hypothetical protein
VQTIHTDIQPLVSTRVTHQSIPANKGISFGMSKQDTVSLLKNDLYSTPEMSVCSHQVLYGVNVSMICEFLGDSLNCLLYKCSYEPPYLDEFISIHSHLVNNISKQYGKPVHLATDWMITDYIGVLGKMGEAYLQKHAFTMHCWLLENGLYVASYIIGIAEGIEILVLVADEAVQTGFRDVLLQRLEKESADCKK